LADELAIPRVIIPPHPGLFSAWGLLVADHTHTDVRSILKPAQAVSPAQLEQLFQELEAQGRQALARDQEHSGKITFRRTLEMRYLGQSFDLTLPAPGALDEAGLAQAQEAFHAL